MFVQRCYGRGMHVDLVKWDARGPQEIHNRGATRLADMNEEEGILGHLPTIQFWVHAGVEAGEEARHAPLPRLLARGIH